MKVELVKKYSDTHRLQTSLVMQRYCMGEPRNTLYFGLDLKFEEFEFSFTYKNLQFLLDNWSKGKVVKFLSFNKVMILVNENILPGRLKDETSKIRFQAWSWTSTKITFNLCRISKMFAAKNRSLTQSLLNCSICAALADVMALAQHGAHY